MIRRLATAVVIVAVAFGFAIRPAHAFTNTCDASSPLLGDAAAYFTFDGVTNGALYQIEARGVYSLHHPGNDCIWAQTTYTGTASRQLYEVGELETNLWYSPSYNVWDKCCGDGTTYNNGPTHYTVMNNAQEIVDANPSFGADCIVFNGVGFTVAQLWDGSNGLANLEYTGDDSSGHQLPVSNTSLICPNPNN